MSSLPLMALLLAILPYPTYGYIDPGSGHFLWQFLLGLIFSGLFHVRSYFRKRKVDKKELAPVETKA